MSSMRIFSVSILVSSFNNALCRIIIGERTTAGHLIRPGRFSSQRPRSGSVADEAISEGADVEALQGEAVISRNNFDGRPPACSHGEFWHASRPKSPRRDRAKGGIQ